MTTLRLARLAYPVTTLGPGRRLGIWLQGCSIGCRGCLSRDTWDPDAVPATPVDDVVAQAAASTDDAVSGITISGGEPFEQPDGLAALLDGLRALPRFSADTVDVLCYSGLPADVLVERHPAILARLDLLIPEPYRVADPTESPWRGSANQPVVALSPLGEARLAASSPPERSVQLSVTEDGVEIIGVPRRGDLTKIERRLADAGIQLRDVSWRP